MSDEQQPLNPSSSDHIEANIGDGASDVIVGKGIRSVRAGERGVAAGDQIHDSVIITGDNNKVVTQRLDPKDAKNQRNHAVMRQLVRKFWIDGVLKSSLYNEVLIRLNLTEQPKAVDNRPWDLILQQPGQPNYEIPPGTPIIDVFDQMSGLLLILGEPGSGKTTMLLELADELLQRAESDPTHPTPVIFNLSSWAEKRQPPAEWLVEELRTKYNIPRKVAQQWIADDELLPLLDGLDEVRQENREDCVKAINRFRQEHLIPIVLCSRTAEYEDLNNRLQLQGAVVVQPLTLTQIDEYLDVVSVELSAVRATLQEDRELQKMATTPLLLSIMVMAYHGVQVEDVLFITSPYTRRHHMFEVYICRMFVHRHIKDFYSIQDALNWLRWLATQMVQYGQTEFLIEQMQPSWAYSSKCSRFMIAATMLIWGPIYGLGSGLILGLIFGLLNGLIFSLFVGLRAEEIIGRSFGPVGGLDTWLGAGLLGGLVFGLIIGILGGLFDLLGGRFRTINVGDRIGMARERVRSSLCYALFWGLILSLIVGQQTNFLYGLIVGLLAALVGGVLGGFREVQPTNMFDFSWRKLTRNLSFGMFNGIIFGLAFGLATNLIFGFYSEVSGRLTMWLFFGLSLTGIRYFIGFVIEKLFVGLISWLMFGLVFGLIFGLIFGPSMNKDVASVNETQVPNQSIKKAAKYMSIIGLSFGLISWLSVGLTVWFAIGQRGGLISPVRGVLSSAPTNGLSAGLVIGLIFGVTGGLVTGCNSVTKHFILRLILRWKGYSPWNYARFLDYCHDRLFLRKVGGGYIFIHRLLLEHFASLADEDIKRLAADIEASKNPD